MAWRGVGVTVLAMALASMAGVASAQPAQGQAPSQTPVGDPAVIATARQLNLQALALIGQKQFDAAERPLKEAMALCEGPLHGEHFCIAATASNLALIAESRGDLLATEALYTRAAAVTRAAMGPQDMQLGEIALKLGRTLMQEGKYAQAEPALQGGLAIRSRGGDAHGTEAGMLDLAQLFGATGRYAQAEQLLRQGLAFCLHGSPTCEATTRARLGETLWSLGRSDEGEAELRKGAALYAAVGNRDGQEGALLALANAFMVSGKFDQAEPLLKAQLQTELARGTDKAANVAGLEADLAKVYASTDRPALAEPLVRSAESRLAAGPMTPTEQGVVAVKAAGAELELNHLAQGRTLLERALATPTPNQAAPLWWKADAEGQLGDVAQLQQRLADAEVLFRKSAEDYAALSNKAMSRLRRNALGAVLLSERRRDEGEAVLKDLLAEVSAAQPANAKIVAAVEANLASAAVDRGDFKAAQTLATDALSKQVPPGEAPGRQATGMLGVLGRAEFGLGLYGAAEVHLLASEKLNRAIRVPHTGELANTRFSLCEVYSAQGRLDDEAACARDLMAMIAGWPEATDDWRLSALITQGNAFYDAGLYQKSRDTFLAATKIETIDLRAAAVANMNLGQAYEATGEYSKAVAAITRSRDLFVKAGAAQEDSGVESGRRLADLYIALGRYQEAEPLIRASLAWFETNLGPGHPRTALQVRALARLMSASGRFAEAEPLYQRALTIRREASSPNLTLVAQSLGDVAHADMALGRYDPARTYLRQAEAAEAEAKGKTHWYVGIAARQLGELDLLQGRYADAEADYRRAEPLLAGGGEAARNDVLRLKADIARLDAAQNRFDAARAILKDILAEQEKVWGPDSINLADTLGMIAALDRDAGRYPAAQTGLNRILAIERATYGEGSPHLVFAWIGLADLLMRVGRGAEAEQAIVAALAIQRAADGVRGPAALDVLLAAANIHAQRGKLAEARGEADKSLALARELKRDPAIVAALEAVGDVARRQQRFADGEAALTEAVDKSRSLWGEATVATVQAMSDLASLEIAAGRPQKAEALFAQAGAAMSKVLPPTNLINIYLANDLALTFVAEGHAAEAEALAKPLLGKLAGRGGEADIASGYVQLTLSKAYQAQGRNAEAVAALAFSRALLGDDPPPPPREQRI